MIEKLPSGLWVIAGDTHLSTWLKAARGRFERSANDCAMMAMLDLIKPGQTVLDIGCLLGAHTYFYAEATGPTGQVVAFDANAEACDCCRHNCPQGWVSVRHVALGAHSGSAKLKLLDNAGASYLADEGVPVAQETLDYFIGDRQVDAIKIDAEGSEVSILAGATKTILRDRPMLVIEVNRDALSRAGWSPEVLLALVESLGYVIKRIPEGIAAGAMQYDILCRPR